MWHNAKQLTFYVLMVMIMFTTDKKKSTKNLCDNWATKFTFVPSMPDLNTPNTLYEIH